MKEIKLKAKSIFRQPSVLDIAVFIQVLFISFQNLFTIRDVLDNDMSKLFVHIAEMWKNKNIFISDWLYEDLELGFSSVFAFFIYGITRNIYFSFGLASIIFLLIYLYVIWEFLGTADFGREERLFAMLVFMVPYSYGQLMYSHMMFFSASYYCIKVLVPLIAFTFLTGGKGYIKKHIPLTVLYFFLLFVTSASTGTYVFITGLVPLIGAYVFMGCPRDREKTLFLTASLADTAAGLAASILAPVSYAAYTAEYKTSEELHEACVSLVTCFFEMMGCFPDDVVPVFSAAGIACLLRSVFSIIFLLFAGAYFVRGLRAIHKKPGNPRDVMSIYALILSACNLIIVIMTGLTGHTRYILISLCPMLFIFAAEIYEKIYRTREKYVQISMLAAFFLMLFLSDHNMAYGNPYPYFRADSVKYDNLQTILDEYPDKNVVFLNDMGTTEILRARNIGNERIFLTYATEDATDFGEGYVVTDYYKSLTEPGCISDDYLLVVNSDWGDIEELPDDMKAGFEEKGRYQNFIVYSR